MRDQTRNYTTALPSLTLAHLKTIRQRFHEGVQALQMGTRAGNIYFHLNGSDYTATIGDKTLSLRLTTTQAGYGVRYWYLCPHCQRRSAALFIGKRDLACRKCWKLHYASQSEDRLARMRRLIRTKRLSIWDADTPELLNLFKNPIQFDKPKGMRWETFERKRSQLLSLEGSYWQAYAPIVERITGGK